jgi:hypothetical protein
VRIGSGNDKHISPPPGATESRIFSSVTITPERELGEQGLGEALDRLERRLINPAEGNLLVSLGDALTWLYALEDYHAYSMGGWKKFGSFRDGSAEGQTLGGLVYARNLMTHGLTEVSRLIAIPGTPVRRVVPGRRGGSVTTPKSIVYYAWKALADLPAPRLPEKHGRDTNYVQHVANRALLPPLRAAQLFLTGLA